MLEVGIEIFNELTNGDNVTEEYDSYCEVESSIENNNRYNEYMEVGKMSNATKRDYLFTYDRFGTLIGFLDDNGFTPVTEERPNAPQEWIDEQVRIYTSKRK